MSENWSVEYEAGLADYEAAQEVAQADEAEVDEVDFFDFVRQCEENDVPMDGDAESALASAGFGTDEDYEHYDDWQNEDYNGMYEGEY